MKWSISKYIYIIFAFIILNVIPSYSQDDNNENNEITEEYYESNTPNRYERRIKTYNNLWQKLIPQYAKIQFAGAMGFMSFGAGWDYGKNHWETELFLGFLPPYNTFDNTKITFTLKQNYIPWNIDLGRNFSFEPLTCSFYINTIFDDDFWMKQPGKYPNKYYFFSTKMRYNGALGQRIRYDIKEEKRFLCKAVSLFYEIGSNDLYIMSAYSNHYLKPNDYLVMSLGLKMHFF